MSWIDPAAEDKLLKLYADFYNGTWIGMSEIKRLAASGKDTPVFSNNVMMNFFEEAMRNARYGIIKKSFLAIILTLKTGFGFFFIRLFISLLNKKVSLKK
jgi:hypothetical protein